MQDDNMVYTNEEQILNESFRAKIISEMVESPENITRKNVALRKHEIYRDQYKKWILHALKREGYKESTLNQMYNRASNVSICKKIINKRAVIYKSGVVRKVDDENSQGSVDGLAKEMDVDTKMIKTNSFLELHNNTMGLIVPRDSQSEFSDQGDALKDIELKVLSPWQYDVIPFPNDREEAAVLILTDHHERIDSQSTSQSSEIQGVSGTREGNAIVGGFNSGDGINQNIANSPSDEGLDDREFIWWSSKYHFTTNSKGEIKKDRGPEDGLNPIGIRNFVKFSGDQDGSFWAMGGDDKVSEALAINKLITDLSYIQFVQGWGQMVVTGKEIPKLLQGGPDNAWILPQENAEDPAPNVFYASSNPPIEQWIESIKFRIALLLTTNNLSTSAISADLNVNNLASGISLLVSLSELTSDLLEEQQLFKDTEPLMWEIIRRWHSELMESGQLTKNFASIPTFEDSNVQVEFIKIKPPISEKENLEELKMRKELGLSSPIELLKLDNPSLTDEQAKEKLQEIQQAKLSAAGMFGLTTNTEKEDDDGELPKETKETKEAEATEEVDDEEI